MKTNLKTYEDIIRRRLSIFRFNHSMGVATTARELAFIYEMPNPDYAYIAGLFHDYAKEMNPVDLAELAKTHNAYNNEIEFTYPRSLHGPVGAYMVKRRGIISNNDILDAIRWHTTGYKNMPLLTALIYIADFIEPNRKNNDQDMKNRVRRAAYNKTNIEDVVNLRRYFTIDTLKKNRAKFIHPLSIKLNNEYISSWK